METLPLNLSNRGLKIPLHQLTTRKRHKKKPKPAYASPRKSPSMMYFLANSQGHPVEIDPTKITTAPAHDQDIFH
eukprot:scaffold334918_cov67-Attheya_sp.AAC.1